MPSPTGNIDFYYYKCPSSFNEAARKNNHFHFYGTSHISHVQFKHQLIRVSRNIRFSFFRNTPRKGIDLRGGPWQTGRLKPPDHEDGARVNKPSAVLTGDGDSLGITSGTVAGRPRNLTIRIIIEGNYVAPGWDRVEVGRQRVPRAWNYTLINGIIFQTDRMERSKDWHGCRELARVKIFERSRWREQSCGGCDFVVTTMDGILELRLIFVGRWRIVFGKVDVVRSIYFSVIICIRGMGH